MRLMRSRRMWAALGLAVAGFALVPLLGGSRAAAHPLGNFTVNRYSRIEVSPEAIRLRYVIDMAEIPAFQEKDGIDTDGNGAFSAPERDAYVQEKMADVRENLALIVAGSRVDLQFASGALSFPSGQGGLETLRLEADFSAPLPDGWRQSAQPVEYHDGNYGDRIGWSEVVVRSEDGVGVVNSSVRAQDVSDELRAYPDDAVSSPLQIDRAEFEVAPGAGSAPISRRAATSTDAGQAAGRPNSRFTSLVTSEEVTIPFVLGAMAIAFAFGALHALGPGHGKTVVAAYLVGERGTTRHALFLGLLVTATHTSSVFALGFITLYASQFIVPERLYPWLGLASGVMVVGIGGLLLISRGRAFLARRKATASPDTNGHVHADGQEHGHSHDVPGGLSWRSLVALGVSGGILPCPSALVVLLGAISLHRVALGLLLVVGFSVGLAAVLTGIGLALVWAGRLAARWQTTISPSSPLRLASQVTPALPAFSAFAITAVGVVMLLRAVLEHPSLGV